MIGTTCLRRKDKDMLVYVGNTEKGYWTEDVAKKHGWAGKIHKIQFAYRRSGK